MCLVAVVLDQGEKDKAAEVACTDAFVREAVKEVIASGEAIPDRGLVQSDDARKKGERANDGEIEAGKFSIVPPAGFSLILDMEPADIILQES